MKIPGKSLAAKIQSARTKVGITQGDLAEKAGIPFRTFQAVEYGTVKEPGFHTVMKIAVALKIDPLDLAGIDREPAAVPLHETTVARIAGIINAIAQDPSILLVLEQTIKNIGVAGKKKSIPKGYSEKF